MISDTGDETKQWLSMMSTIASTNDASYSNSYETTSGTAEDAIFYENGDCHVDISRDDHGIELNESFATTSDTVDDIEASLNSQHFKEEEAVVPRSNVKNYRLFDVPFIKNKTILKKENEENLETTDNKSDSAWKSAISKVGSAVVFKNKSNETVKKSLLLQHERDYLRDLFNNFDILKRGDITNKDFEVILRTFLNRNITPQEVTTLLIENDIQFSEEANIVISLNNFLSIMTAAVETYRRSKTTILKKEKRTDWERIGEIIVNKANRRRMLLQSASGIRWRSEDEESTALYRNFMEPFKIRSNRSENMKKAMNKPLSSDSTKFQTPEEIDVLIKAQVPWSGPWNPECWQKIFWDFSIMLLVLFQSIYIPFVFCFQPTLSKHWTLADILFDVAFSIDLVFTFNFMYRAAEGQPLISDRQSIARNYICGWFTVDFLGSVPIELLFQGNNKANILGIVKVLRLPRMLRLMKMFRMFRFKQVLDHHPDISWWLQYSKQANLLRIIQMLVTIGFILHWTACILYLVSSNEEWMGIQSCDWGWNETSHEPLMSACGDATYASRYMTAYYSSLLLINGENVNPTSSRELIFATVMLLIGSVLIASIFGNVSISISNFSEASTQSHGKLEQILNLMNHIDLPQPFRKRAVKYYERIWSKYRSLDGELRMFLPELNSSLRAEVLISMRTQLIIEVPLFHKCGPGMIKEMVLKLKDEFHLAGDYIVQTGSIPVGITMVTTGYCEATSTLTTNNNDNDQQSSLPNVDKNDDAEDDQQEEEVKDDDDPKGGIVPFLLSKTMSKKVPVPLPSSKETVIKVFSEGDHFGDLALICNCQAMFNIRSTTDIEICTLTREDLEDIIVQQEDHLHIRNSIKSMILIEHEEASNSSLDLFKPLETEEEEEVKNIEDLCDQIERVEDLLKEFQDNLTHHD